MTDAPVIDVYISAMKPEFAERGILRVYKGNYEVVTFEVEPGIKKFYRIDDLQGRFNGANENMFNQGGFAPNVWRIVCDCPTYTLQGIDVHEHEIRPPKPEELPALNWLAYGSSITNAHLDGYIHVAARKLRVQVQNKGFSGSCFCEKELVDYLVDECESDFMTCEIGINMRGWCSVEEFRKRVEYLVNRLVETKKPAVLISTFPNKRTYKYSAEHFELSEREAEYERILEELVNKADCKFLKLIKGEEILTDIYGLKGDLLHPSIYGHAVMGINLAEKLASFLSEQGIYK